MQITVTLPDGGTAEVDPSALALPDGAQIVAPGQAPDGFVSQAYHDRRLAETGRDASAAEKAAKRKLAADPEFRAEVAKGFGLDVRDGQPVVPDADQMKAQLREAILRDELEPVKTERDALLDAVRRRSIVSELATLKDDEGQPLIDERYLKPGPSGKTYAEMEFGAFVKVDPRTGEAVALDATGEPVRSTDPARAYATPGEHFRALLESDQFAHLRPPPPAPQGGPGYRGSAAPKSSGLRRSAMTAHQKAEYMKEHGKDAYESLPYD